MVSIFSNFLVTDKLGIFRGAHKLLVHCGAGISRSTAVACGILCQHRLSPKEAIDTVYLLRKGACPNEHIIALMDEALDLKGSLSTYLKSSK